MKEGVFERTLNAFRQADAIQALLVERVSGTRLTIDHPGALVDCGRAAMHVDQEGNFTLFDNEGVSWLADIKRNGSGRRT
jgi:hypothetical protein